MPYLKKRTIAFEDVGRLLKGYDLTGCRLARVLDKCESTARNRMRNPGEFTLNELSAICKSGHVPAEKIKEAIKFS